MRLSKDKKYKEQIRKIKPPEIGIISLVANDLCDENFLSTRNSFLFKI